MPRRAAHVSANCAAVADATCTCGCEDRLVSFPFFSTYRAIYTCNVPCYVYREGWAKTCWEGKVFRGSNIMQWESRRERDGFCFLGVCLFAVFESTMISFVL